MATWRSSQSLWKIITGHSAIRDDDLILDEVAAHKAVLMKGLGFFKPPRSQSELDLKSSDRVKGRKLEFVCLISKKLGLDEMQSLDLFQNFLLEGYHGSFDDVNKKLSNNSDKEELLSQVEDYYNKERLYLLRCIKQLFGYWQDGSHPYREVYEKSLVKIEFDGPKFIPEVWNQLEKICLLEVPAGIESPDKELKWLKQNILEQIELMEILLLFYKDYEMSIELMVDKFKFFQRIGFGLAPRGRYTPGISNDPLSHHLSHLCILVLLEALDLEYLLQKQDDPAGAQDHHLSKPDVSEKLKEFENLLKDSNHTPCQTPLLLSWFILRYILCEDDGDMCNAKLLGNTALHGNVFEVILTVLKSPFFTGERPVAGVCQSVFYTLLSLAVSSFSEDSLGGPMLLYEIASCVLNQPRMRITFWEKGLDNGLGLLVKGAMSKFPLNGIMDLLLPLSRDEFSAHSVYNYLSTLPSYTEELAPHMLQVGMIDIGPEEGTWVISTPRCLFEQEYQSLGLPPLVLDRGVVGVVVKEEAEEDGDDVQVVSWQVEYSGWELFAVFAYTLLNTPGIGVDTEPHPLIDFVSRIYKLVIEVVQHDPSVVPNLHPILSLIYPILQKFSQLPHPPAMLISSCVDCLAVLAERRPGDDLWDNLQRTGFLPQLLTSAEQSDSLQTSPGLYGHLLNNWERARGLYPITTAMLHLLFNTLKSCDHHMMLEGVVASTVYIMQAVFVSSHNWRYQSQARRDEFCHQLLKLCCSILKKGCGKPEQKLQAVLHQFVVNLLLHSSGHLLLVNTLGTGVNTIDRITSQAIGWSQPALAVESLKLCFTITDLLLLNKKEESVTPLEQALATRTIHHPSLSMSSSLSSSKHLITELFTYIHHHEDPAVPIGATKLLARLATVAPMSMFSCLGHEAIALRDCFVTRLSANSEDTELRIAILKLVSCSIGSQPGLLELFLSLKTKQKKESDRLKPAGKTGTASTSKTDPPKDHGQEEVTTLYTMDDDSCLQPVLDMIDPDKKSPPVPSSLLSAGMGLLRNLWHARHTGALEAVRTSSENFWKHLFQQLMTKVDINMDDKKLLTQKFQTSSHVMFIVTMELYYAVRHKLDQSLKAAIHSFVRSDGFTVWCKCLQCLVSDSIEMEETGVGDVPLEALAAQEQLADSWRALLIVAAHQHEPLFDMDSARRKSGLLCELLHALESQVIMIPKSVGVMSRVLSLYMTLVRKWESFELVGSVVSSLGGVLESVIMCDSSPDTWELLTLLYSTIIVVVSSLRRNEGEVEPRFLCGMIPSIQSTIETHTYYEKLDIKHHPEVYAISLLSEITLTLPSDHTMWLDSLKNNSIVMILIRTATGYLNALSRPDIIEAILCFFVNLANSTKGAELLQVNNVSQLLSITLGNVVSKLDTMGSSITVALTKVLVPDPEWMRVWQASVKLETRLLSRLGHHFIDRSLDFVGSHSDRIQQCLDIYVATRHMQAVAETRLVCLYLQQLAYYRQQWMFGLLNHHNNTINRIIHLLNGAVAVLTRGRVKDVVKTMNAQGLLPAGHTSTSVRASKDHQRRTSSGQTSLGVKLDDDSWIKCSPAYTELQGGLVSIVTSCVCILNFYTPPLSDIFMCTLTQPVDLSQWPPLFNITSLPVVDPTAPPSMTTLTGALSIGCDILRKLDPHGHKTGTPSKSSPVRSPVTPFAPRPASEAAHQKRTETLYMLEQTVTLLISQALRYLLDGEVHPAEKQALKKHLVSELSTFCQSLLLNFSRKGAPSPHSTTLRMTTPISSSYGTLQDNLSGRTSSYSFSDTQEQGIFKLADMFAKNLTR